jgi:hypothetical protein
MRKRLVAPLFILLAAAARAQPCHHDTISTSPGPYLFTQTGQSFAIIPTSTHITDTWLPMDRLLVCYISATAFELTNLDRRNQQAEALLLP